MVYNRMNDHNYNRVLVATGVEQQTVPAIKMTPHNPLHRLPQSLD